MKKTFEKVDNKILKALPNPSEKSYEIKIKNPELTFLGVYDQPDFASLYILFYPNKKIIELKSLKNYLHQYRNIIISYERLINIVYEDLMKVYEPSRLRLVLDCNPRGGISSRLTQDSDWKSLGGDEKYSGYEEIIW
ncbi:MAG: preQ(1) synthase [Bacteroidota bacterium]